MIHINKKRASDLQEMRLPVHLPPNKLFFVMSHITEQIY